MSSVSMLHRAALLAASITLLAGCGAIEDLLGGDDEPPPVVDPAIEPPTHAGPQDPAPDPAQPEARDQGTGGAQQGGSQPGWQFPGLEGLPLPIPLPNANTSDPEPPARGSLAAAPAGSFDAGGHMMRSFLEQEAQMIHQALVAALDEHENGQVRAIPFEVVQEDLEPNAAAGCTRSTRSPVMMITTAMLTLAAGISETKAYDEVAGTDTYSQYVTTVIEEVRAERPVPPVAASLHAAPHASDPHKLARQRHIFDQQIAFIVGHELAHHYRGHTNCVEGRTEAEVQRDELALILAHTVPPFSQPREVEADMWGVTNVLEAGRNRAGGTWNHEGALINLDFFRRLSDQGGAELVLAFLSTHPPAIIRIPIVRSTGQQWTPGWRPPAMPVPGEGGTGGIELPTPGGPLRLPDPSQLPIDPSRFPFPFPQPQQRDTQQR